MKNIRTVFALFVAVMALGISPLANAHKVNLFAYAEEGEVYVEGYFVDGKKAQNSTVQVFNPAGEMINEGMTDSEGVYRFPISEKSDLKITVNAGMGHKGEFMLPANELGGEPAVAEQNDASSHESNDGHQQGDQVVDQGSPDSSALASSSYTDAELQKAVRHAVNEAIKPLVRSLEESQQKASLTGIVGGVGYIVGFLGLFAFMKARQQLEKGEKA